MKYEETLGKHGSCYDTQHPHCLGRDYLATLTPGWSVETLTLTSSGQVHVKCIREAPLLLHAPRSPSHSLGPSKLISEDVLRGRLQAEGHRPGVAQG